MLYRSILKINLSMNKYILIGGGNIIDKNALIDTITNSYSKNSKCVNILIVPFARYSTDWPGIFKRYIKRYEGIVFNKKFVLASTNLKIFNTQLNKSDIIILCGGNENLLLPLINRSNFREIKNKMVVATSAGANILSCFFYSNDRNRIENGLGILQIKTICHYNKRRIERLNKLKNHHKVLETYAISEGEFIYI